MTLLDDLCDLVPWLLFSTFLLGVAGCLLVVWLGMLVFNRSAPDGLEHVTWHLEYFHDVLRGEA